MKEGPCGSDQQCNSPAFCTDSQSGFQRVFSAVEGGDDGSELYLGAGKCLGGPSGICDVHADCDPDELCEQGTCRLVGDACDRETCGNGLQEYIETCDHGAQNGLDGLCGADCAYLGGGTACSDGVDNDGDGKIDWDGAGFGDPDPQCPSPWMNREKKDCGLGAELVLLAPLFRAIARRRRGDGACVRKS